MDDQIVGPVGLAPALRGLESAEMAQKSIEQEVHPLQCADCTQVFSTLEDFQEHGDFHLAQKLAAEDRAFAEQACGNGGKRKSARAGLPSRKKRQPEPKPGALSQWLVRS